MGIVAERRRFTVDEYRRLGETGILSALERIELVEGELVLMPPIGFVHASIVGSLTMAFAPSAQFGALLWVQNPISFPPDSEPQPDLALLKGEAADFGRRLPLASDVLLVIEVSDTTQAYDRDTKITLYAKHGVPESWLVDASRRSLEIYRDPGPAGYRMILRPDVDAVVSPSLLPDIRIDLARVFAGLR